MEVGTARKRAAETEADDGKRASRAEASDASKSTLLETVLSELLVDGVLKALRCVTHAVNQKSANSFLL
eukprot:2068087-Amphidinium_carterae.1